MRKNGIMYSAYSGRVITMLFVPDDMSNEHDASEYFLLDYLDKLTGGRPVGTT